MSPDLATDLDRLAQRVPSAVQTICKVLQQAGHQAVTVGGAVRDAMLERDPGDWDVATSALPKEVQTLFPRTIPTGIEHGTVTVLLGKGKDRHLVEVTTFRGEGAYSDGRRPDHVEFGVSLTDDLSRRDFVVNAIAFDPIAKVLHDPFGGADDIRAKRLRAVGNAEERFNEDGLRVMRAVRFVATLGFTLDPPTGAAIGGALGSLARVSNERVRVELYKLLCNPDPRLALDIAKASGILTVILPEQDPLSWPTARDRALRTPADPPLRLAALLLEADGKIVDEAMRRLTLSNQDRGRVVTVVRHARPPGELDDRELRRTLGLAGRGTGALDLVAIWRADQRDPLAKRSETILASGDALTVSELVLGGEDLQALGVKKGPEMGNVLRLLLDDVLADPGQNTEPRLKALVARHVSNLKTQ